LITLEGDRPWGPGRRSYKGHRYPVEGHLPTCVWLYFRFPLRFREVEELTLQRGVIVSYETVRALVSECSARPTRRAASSPAPAREQVAPGRGVRQGQREQKYLWRAVDQDGNVLDILLQSRRGREGRQALLPGLMKKTRAVPRVVVTDKLRPYGAGHREVIPPWSTAPTRD